MKRISENGTCSGIAVRAAFAVALTCLLMGQTGPCVPEDFLSAIEEQEVRKIAGVRANEVIDASGFRDGFDCWDLNANGVPDIATEDTNADGVVDTRDCQGDPGPDGMDGQDGAMGDPGDDGQDGTRGQKGDKGDPGISCWDLNENGIRDLPDEDRDGDGDVDLDDCSVGPPGPKGDKGDKGDTGATGANGADGIDGTNGRDGSDGTDGRDGIDGATGSKGDPGVPWTLRGTSAYYNGGNVGIGRSDPADKLEVRTSSTNQTAIFGDSTGAGGGGVWGRATSSSGIGLFGFATSSSGTNYAVRGATNSGSGYAAYFEGGRNYYQGNVGIGTSNPSHKLTVQSPEDTFRLIGPSSFGHNAQLNFGDANFAYIKEDLDDRLRFYANRFAFLNGGVGLGLDNPSYRLELPNHSSLSGRGLANRWDTYSSARWKENVEQVDDALNKVLRLRGVTFEWLEQALDEQAIQTKNGPIFPAVDRRDIGFIAEEVGAVFPEIVTWESDGSGFAKGLDYGRIVPVLVEAIRELRLEKDEQIAKLETRLEALEALTKPR